jgi:hypothetical protein
MQCQDRGLLFGMRLPFKAGEIGPFLPTPLCLFKPRALPSTILHDLSCRPRVATGNFQSNAGSLESRYVVNVVSQASGTFFLPECPLRTCCMQHGYALATAWATAARVMYIEKSCCFPVAIVRQSFVRASGTQSCGVSPTRPPVRQSLVRASGTQSCNASLEVERVACLSFLRR